jgi:hypothetical protein
MPTRVRRNLRVIGLRMWMTTVGPLRHGLGHKAVTGPRSGIRRNGIRDDDPVVLETPRCGMQHGVPAKSITKGLPGQRVGFHSARQGHGQPTEGQRSGPYTQQDQLHRDGHALILDRISRADGLSGLERLRRGHF